MELLISHSWDEETMEAKAHWFQSLTMEQRFEVFCEFMTLIEELNPSVFREKNVTKPAGGLQVLTRE